MRQTFRVGVVAAMLDQKGMEGETFFPFVTRLKTLLDDIVYKVWSSQFGVESQWSTSTEHQYINKH